MTFFGEIGKLNEEGEKVQCHICGKYFRNLGLHVSRGHKIMCDEYRETYGLSRNFALCSEAFSAIQRDNHGERIAALGEKGRSKIAVQTREQLQALAHMPRRKSTSIKNRAARIRENSSARLQTPEARAKALQKHRITCNSEKFKAEQRERTLNFYKDSKNAAVLANKKAKLKESCNKPEYLECLSARVKAYHASKKEAAA